MSAPKDQTLTLLRDADQDWARFREVQIRLEQPGQQKAQERVLALDLIDVGSSPECELICDDPQVSRRHCQLGLAEEGISLEDLGSKNGTFVNGVRISKVWVAPGQVITLGSSRLELVLAKKTTQVPLYRGAKFGGVTGASIVMRGLFAELERAAKSDATLLLWGETGTGKELVARAVHDEGTRASGPFVVVDCGAVPEALLEAELFGHDPGAFSGAERAREGLVEQAEGGTLFLDEIGELPLVAQTALLRLLERKSFRRVGGNEDKKADVRIIAATHRDLRARVAAREFREDLYFRLAVLEVTLPPLRQRLDDLPLLVEGFLAEKSPARTLSDLPAGLLDMFKSHNWPGNVRELKNVIERLRAFPNLPPDELLQRDPRTAIGIAPLFSHLPLRQARDAAVDHFEREYIREKLAKHQGSVAAAAAEIGVSRQFLYRLMARHDV
jgi:two-component system, NtrC family, response regulator GlrR